MLLHRSSITGMVLAGFATSAWSLDVTRTITFDDPATSGPDAGLSSISGNAIPGGLPDLTADGVGIGGTAALRMDAGDPLIGGSFSSGVYWEGFWAANDGSGSLPAGTPLDATTGSGVLYFGFNYKIESPNNFGGRDELHMLLTYSDENKSPDYRPLYNFGANAEIGGQVRYRTGSGTDRFTGPEYINPAPHDSDWLRFNNYVQLFDVPVAGGGSEQGAAFLQTLNEAEDAVLGFDFETDATYAEVGFPHAQFDTEKVAGIQLFGRNLLVDSVHLIDNIVVGLVDTADVDIVTADIGTSNARSDFTNDGTIDTADRLFLIETILASEIGDLNLDRVVDAADAAIAQGNNGLSNAGYGDGDVDFDGDVDAADLAFFGLVGTITGDYDTSGQVEQGDLDIVLQNWGTGTFTGDEAALVGGGPFDGTVDQNELDGVLQNWGSTSAPDFDGNAVPEPAALSTLLGIALLRRRGRRD